LTSDDINGMRAAQLTSLCRLWHSRRAPAGPSAFVSAVPTPAAAAERGSLAPVALATTAPTPPALATPIGAGDVLH
jgi:hypothetical protein